VHALRNVHAALVPGGTLLDVHPIPPDEQVEAGGRILGRLDESEFLATVDAVEDLLDEVVADGLFDPVVEAETDVLERFDTVTEVFEIVGEREGVSIPARVARAVREAEPPIWLRERLALRVYRSSAGS
jgi:hypothetical protein